METVQGSVSEGHSSLGVANIFIKKFQQEEKRLTVMQIMKIVYIAHGWILGHTDKPLIYDSIEAWQYGPVIPVIYNKFRPYGLIIEKLAKGDKNKRVPAPILDGDEQNIVEEVYSVYSEKPSFVLSNLTHRPNTPWSQVYGNGYRMKIPNDIIKEYYKKRIANMKKNGR